MPDVILGRIIFYVAVADAVRIVIAVKVGELNGQAFGREGVAREIIYRTAFGDNIGGTFFSGGAARVVAGNCARVRVGQVNVAISFQESCRITCRLTIESHLFDSRSDIFEIAARSNGDCFVERADTGFARRI